MTGRLVHRRSVLAGAAALAAGAFTGCGRRTDDRAMRFWQFYAPGGENPKQVQWFADLVERWNAENDRPVQLQFVPSSEYINGSKLQISFSAENGPDVFVVSPGDFLRYYNGGVLVDLTPYLSKEERADFYPELLETRCVDDRVYALPMGGGPLAMYYSVPAFERAGLSEADVPTTWEQLVDVAERLTTRDRFGVLFETLPGYYQNFTWHPFLWMGGGELPTPDSGGGVFDRPATVAALRLWQRLVERGAAPRKALGGGATDVVSNLGAGYCAMQNAGMWGVSNLKAGKPDLEYGVFRLPLPPGGHAATATGGWAFAANARGRDPDAAARFCVWAIGSTAADSVDRAARWCVDAQSYLPYRKSAMRRAEELGAFEDPRMATFRTSIFPDARGEPRLPPEMNKVVSDAIQACQLAGADPKTEAARAAESFDSLFLTYAGAPPA